jgi:hypothetical protein
MATRSTNGKCIKVIKILTPLIALIFRYNNLKQTNELNIHYDILFGFGFVQEN